MNKDFVTYNQALALKELGYNEPCFATGFADDSLFFISPNNLKDERHEPLCVTNDECIWEDDEECINGLKEVLKPTKSQVFRFFREKYNQNSFIELAYQDGIKYDYVLYADKDEEECGNFGDGPFNTYEEAENACIDKLIELVKQQDNGK